MYGFVRSNIISLIQLQDLVLFPVRKMPPRMAQMAFVSQTGGGWNSRMVVTMIIGSSHWFLPALCLSFCSSFSALEYFFRLITPWSFALGTSGPSVKCQIVNLYIVWMLANVTP
jgi:hypothetical protein